MADEHYTLFYFHFRARAEAIRMILHANGVHFEDVRFGMNEWPERRNQIPGSRVPLLQVKKAKEVVNYVESMAIARMLAKRFNMMGDSEEEYYNVERMIGECADLDKEFYTAFFAPPDQKEEMLKKSMSEAVPKMLDLISKSISESGGKFVAGDKVTLGDICLLTSMDHVRKHDPEFLGKHYPKLLALEKEVLKAKPKLAEYIRTRPETPL
ncbi:glutathione S-transferase protein [Opisthorchis viverrini]|uniref:glutathione transferase n=1 Tax=Opisthorchis viverrini TaxID=6198 RepID=A0A1S8WW85_OPIVI|nr:glutathione S-transferase protein [Opisthorchis viverrini]